MLSNASTNLASTLPSSSPTHTKPTQPRPSPPPQVPATFSSSRPSPPPPRLSLSSRTLTSLPLATPSRGNPESSSGIQPKAELSRAPAEQSNTVVSPKPTRVLAEWEDVCNWRDEFLTQTARQRSRQELIRLLRRRAQDARADFMKLLNATVVRNDFAQAHSRLLEIGKEVEAAEEALSLQEHDLAAVEGELLVFGHRLQQKEQSLQDNLGSFLSQEEHRLPELPSSPTASCSSDSGFSMPDNPLLAQFYSCIGDIKILRDRLEQLQNSHESEQEFRNRHEKAGLPTLLSDTDFKNEYITQHQSTKQKLHEAKKEARRLESLCRQQAFNLSDAGALSEVSTSTSSEASSDGALEIGDESIQTRFPVFFQKSSESLLSRFRNRRDRVNRWLMDVLRISRLQVVRHRAFTNQNWNGSPSSDNTWSRQVWSSWSIESSADGSVTLMARGVDSTNESRELSVLDGSTNV